MFLYKYLSVIAIFIFRFCNSSVCMFCLASSRLPFILPANRHCHRYSDAQCVQCVHCEFHNSLSLFCPGLLCSVCRFAGERVQIALNSKHQTEAPEGRHDSLSLGAMTLVQSLTRTTFSTLPDVLGGNRIRFTTSAESLPSHRASLPSYLPFIMKNAEKCSQQSEKFDIILVSVCVKVLAIFTWHFPLIVFIFRYFITFTSVGAWILSTILPTTSDQIAPTLFRINHHVFSLSPFDGFEWVSVCLSQIFHFHHSIFLAYAVSRVCWISLFRAYRTYFTQQPQKNQRKYAYIWIDKFPYASIIWHLFVSTAVAVVDCIERENVMGKKKMIVMPQIWAFVRHINR